METNILRYWLQYLLFAIGFSLINLSAFAEDVEFRGFWVDAFHSGFTNKAEVTKLIAEVRAANGNAVVVEVRKRGDAFYNSQYEPKAAGIERGYDPLADLIAQGHDTNGGPRIEVHAWMLAYPVWRGADGFPSQTNHPYLLHKDWLDQTSRGETYNGKDYCFDPGHPKVQEHLFKVAMDIVSHYDVDGLNLDYIHYSGKEWGFNTNAVGRFNERMKRKGMPSSNDPAWMQFRRDQVTGLLRKIYLSAIAVKPEIKISAATITWPPAPKDLSEWPARATAYRELGQDWRAWMEEGILDINMPMIYVGRGRPEYAALFAKWVEFSAASRYGRQVVVSPAIFLNTVTNSLTQIREARAKGGKDVAGVCLYSYASYTSEKKEREEFLAALTGQGSPRDAAPVFAKPVGVPEMPWKTNPKTGHLKGFVYDEGGTNVVDGATVSLKGAKAQAVMSDATGFYGFVDLPPGNYSVVASSKGINSKTNTVETTAGKVSSLDIHFDRP